MESRKYSLRSLSVVYNSQTRYRDIRFVQLVHSCRSKYSGPPGLAEPHGRHTLCNNTPHGNQRTQVSLMHPHRRGHYSESSRLSQDGTREGVVRHALIISSSFPYLQGTSAAPVVSLRDKRVTLDTRWSLICVCVNFYHTLSKVHRREIYSAKSYCEGVSRSLNAQFLRALFSMWIADRDRFLSLFLSPYLSLEKIWFMRREIGACPDRKTYMRCEELSSTRAMSIIRYRKLICNCKKLTYHVWRSSYITANDF